MLTPEREREIRQIYGPENVGTSDETLAVVNDLLNEVERLRQENERPKGAIAAQDNRERMAGEECGVPYELHGCDWPEAAAERILVLQKGLERLRKLLEERK